MTHVLVSKDPVTPHRPYAFANGDLRKVNREEALQAAIERAHNRGIRQSVRKSTAPDFAGGEFWLVQDVG